MTVIDIKVICDSLGISKDAYFSAADKIADLTDLLKDFDIEPYFELTHDELIAIIRYEKLDKRHPEYFTWDGFTEKAEKIRDESR
ncbi:MAG: hypothetical protein ACOYIK_09895 [Coriobacteriales bacterium]|jgi:hypothetical protein